MSKRLKPAEMIEARSFAGHTTAELRRMLEHYGFELTHRGDSKHFNFQHREYRDIPIVRLPHGGGEMKRVYAEDSAEACMEVKRRNAQRGLPEPQPVPDWVRQGIRATVEEDGCTLYFNYTNGADPAIPPRRYQVFNNGEAIVIRNLDLPDRQVNLNQREGSKRRSQNVAQVIESLDQGVCRYFADHNAQYIKLHRALHENLGFVIDAEQQEEMLSVRHPALGVQFSMARPSFAAEVSVEDMHAMQDAKHAVEQRFLDGLATIDELEGWEGFHNHDDQRYILEDAAGHRISLPTFGSAGIFDPDQIDRELSLLTPELEADGALPEPPGIMAAETEEPAHAPIPSSPAAVQSEDPAPPLPEPRPPVQPSPLTPTYRIDGGRLAHNPGPVMAVFQPAPEQMIYQEGARNGQVLPRPQYSIYGNGLTHDPREPRVTLAPAPSMHDTMATTSSDPVIRIPEMPATIPEQKPFTLVQPTDAVHFPTMNDPMPGTPGRK